MCWEKHKGVDLKQGDLPAVCRKGGCDAIPMEVWMSLRREVGVMRRGRKVADIRTSWEKELLSPGIQSGAVKIIVC